MTVAFQGYQHVFFWSSVQCTAWETNLSPMFQKLTALRPLASWLCNQVEWFGPWVVTNAFSLFPVEISPTSYWAILVVPSPSMLHGFPHFFCSLLCFCLSPLFALRLCLSIRTWISNSLSYHFSQAWSPVQTLTYLAFVLTVTHDLLSAQ